MTRMMKWPFLAFLLIASYCPNMRAQTINAASCSQTDVQNALNSVAADGTTVVIPAGTCAWTTSGAAAVTYKQVYSTTIIGATFVNCTGTPGTSSYSCTATDNTTIIDHVNHQAAGFGDLPDLRVITAAGKLFRLSGITFTQDIGSVQSYNGGALRLEGSSQSVRMDHMHFAKINSLAFQTNGTWSGVIDHNLCEGTAGSGWRDQMTGNGDADWNTATNLGTSGSGWRYYESNQFNGFGNDGRNGGRIVYRFNAQLSTVGTEPLQTHATGSAGDSRGERALEVYRNVFNSPNYTADTMIEMTSGTGVIWGNTLTPTSPGWKNFVRVVENRICAPGTCASNTGYAQSAPPNGWGYCGTAYGPSTWDQNQGSAGRRCLDAIGTGKSDLLSGNFPSKLDSATGTITWPNQASEPVYEWMDSWTNPGAGGQYWANLSGGVLINNSDWYLWCDPASHSGCTSFNGTVGVGSGTLASRPSTCTVGVGYWATDQGNWNQSGSGGQGQLFTCSAPNTWTLYYTPYTYPHPLVVGSGTSPMPPTNVQAIAN